MNYLTLSDIRLLAVEVSCINSTTVSARECFLKRLRQQISWAPKIRFWA